MGKVFEKIEPRLKTFIEKQKLFFVGTAPLTQDGLVNVSPKGLDSLRVLDEKTVAYIDLTGSGAETIAHLKENQHEKVNRHRIRLTGWCDGRPHVDI